MGDLLAKVEDVASLPYKDKSLGIPHRVDDLVSRLTLEEKAGLLFHSMLVPGPDGKLSDGDDNFSVPSSKDLIVQKRINHFNLVGPVTDVRQTVEFLNAAQKLAVEGTRWSIPITFSTDPRNHFSETVGTSSVAASLSQWPESLGFAALRDAQLTERFADIARREYLALGLRVSLGPQADLSTEYRWARLTGTFGECADLSSELTAAYIRGFQAPQLSGGTGKLSIHSVSTVTKHFPGGGPERDGEDSHFVYGQDQVYPGDNFDYHLKPFKKAIEAGARQIMPYYSKPVGLKDPRFSEEVGFGFHKGIITTLLREEMGFQGIVCSDWGLVTDATIRGEFLAARAWGCQDLSPVERVAKIFDAGCDQLGGEFVTELVIEAVETGLISQERIDKSVRKILAEKFELGLFDSPYIDPDDAERIVGHPDFIKEGELAQRSSITLLVNKESLLPLSLSDVQGKKVYTEGLDKSILQEAYGITTTENVSEADLAILRLRAPYEPRPGGFECNYHTGSLEFPEEEKERQAKILSSVPISVVDIYLERPAAVPELFQQATAVTANFGSNLRAFIDVVFGIDGTSPQGKLPFDLPSSMEAVVSSREDVPFDTKNPAFRFGHGLTYN